MKCSELIRLIEEVSGLVAAGQGQPMLLVPLKRLLSCSPNKTVADFANRLKALTPDATVEAEGFKLEQAIEVLELVQVLLQDFGKPSSHKDLTLLLPALRLHASSNIDRLVSVLESPGSAKQPKRSHIRKWWLHTIDDLRAF